MPIKVTISDRRIIEAALPVEGEDLAAFTTAQSKAFVDGYKLTAVGTINGGSQVDPVTTGIRLVFSR